MCSISPSTEEGWQQRCNHKLTAIVFIRAIATVVVTITHPCFRDAPVVITGKVVSPTGGRDTSGTVNFIRTISTVVYAITVPAGVYAVLVVAGESERWTGCSWWRYARLSVCFNYPILQIASFATPKYIQITNLFSYNTVKDIYRYQCN